MKKIFIQERAEELKKFIPVNSSDVLTEEKIRHLPEAIKNYIRICGHLNKPNIFNAEVIWKESFLKMKPGGKWTPLHTIQFNSINPIVRIAYMKFKGLPIAGRDIYRSGKGEMKGKLLNLFTIIYGAGAEVSQSALITAFSEFLLIPGYVLHDYVEWKQVNDTTVEALLTVDQFKVSGTFYFDDKGLFTRFETNDRFYAKAKDLYIKVPFLVEVDSYQTKNGITFAKDVKASWQLKNGKYEYYKGTIDVINVNVKG